MENLIGGITIKQSDNDEFLLIADENSDYSQENLNAIVKAIETETGKEAYSNPATFSWHVNPENTDECYQWVSVA